MPMSPRLLRPRASGLVLPSDADARAYVLAVNTADGQPLEAPVVQAIDAFVIGCKADGTWSAIKASCILMGARTLSGALTPLVGTAPTNNNFVSGDYNRKTGLVGNGSTKYLNSNRAGGADGTNDAHLAAYISTHHAAGGFGIYIGAGGISTTGANNLGRNNSPDLSLFARCRSQTVDISLGPNPAVAGFAGWSRSGSSSYTFRTNSADSTVTRASQSPSSLNLFVFARLTSSGPNVIEGYSDGRMAFYSIGSALTLSSLDSRVSTLYTAIGAAIP